MSLRLLPFRQYDEQDVINIFVLESDLALTSSVDDGQGSNGVFVKVTNGDFDQDTITYGTNSYLGKTDYPFVSDNMYPSNPLTISGATSGDLPLGLTLNQTAEADENGEKLIYNPIKKEELKLFFLAKLYLSQPRVSSTLASAAFDAGAYGVGSTASRCPTLTMVKSLLQTQPTQHLLVLFLELVHALLTLLQINSLVVISSLRSVNKKGILTL